ncbi:MAG TPA: beta-xylosidase [Phycisphaerae bacterium]
MKSSRLIGFGLILAVAGAAAIFQAQTTPAATAPVAVTITIDASKSTGKLNPIWRWEGYDEPNYTYYPNGKKLISQFQGDKNSSFGPAYFRAHNLLVTGDGTPKPKWGSTNIYTEDAQGKPVYSWTIVDKILDTYIDAGARPYLQVGFMPKALSLRPDPYEHSWTPAGGGNLYTGWTSPPNNYDKWRELNFQWAKHCVEKYGMDEVKKWYWEIWNEPNIGYFTAAERGGNKTVDYEKVWDYAADGIRKAVPDAVISGAETAGDGAAFQRDFIEHCINGTNYATGQKGSPLGMISFHAKGNMGNSAGFRQRGYVQMGVSSQLSTVNAGFNIVRSRPETASLPVVIGESDPDGCAACQSYNGLYPENGYRNSSIFAAYTIEQLVRTMDLAQGSNVNLRGAVTWAFEFENQPIFAGFRALATDGVALPVLNTFRMLNKMGTQRLGVTSTGDLGGNTIMRQGVRGTNSDVMALASRDDRRITILAWNYHDNDVPGPAADITINLAGIPAEVTSAKLSEWRVDETHSNAFTAWKGMGSPAVPTAEQHQQLEGASNLSQTQAGVNQTVAAGAAQVKITVPRQGLSLIELSW